MRKIVLEIAVENYLYERSIEKVKSVTIHANGDLVVIEKKDGTVEEVALSEFEFVTIV